MEKLIVSSVENGDYKSINLNKIFDPDGKHQYTFEFQRSYASNPFSQGWGKLEIQFVTLQPEKAYFPYHYHTANEEVFYIINGQGTLKTPEGEKTVSEGDVIIMPAHENGAHMLINNFDVPLIFIEIKTVNSPDIAIRPEDGKFAVMGGPKELFLKTFKIDSAVNYLANE